MIVHTLLKGHYVRTLQPPVERLGVPLSILAMRVSDEGHIAVHCRQQLGHKINQVSRAPSYGHYVEIQPTAIHIMIDFEQVQDEISRINNVDIRFFSRPVSKETILSFSRFSSRSTV